MNETAARTEAGDATLLRRWERLRTDEPKLRARDAAARLGVGEAELVAARAGDGVTEIGPDFGAALEGLPALGEVMALTRNDFAVHEKIGRFDNVDVQPGHAIVVNRDIDLRLFMGHWHFGFAVDETVASGRRRSLQFFDVNGTAVHKIYLRDGSDVAAYEALVERYRRAGTRTALPVLALPAQRADAPDADIDVAGLRAHWAALQDTHDFVRLLRAFGVGRVQALRLAEPSYAWPVEPDALERTLMQASTDAVPIMCFVGNAGCIQIHTGPVATLKRVGRWYNVLDPAFNLHVDTDGIASAWVVRKPTHDGVVTSLELYAADGGCILRLFGERKPGRRENAAWTALLDGLPARVPT